MLKLGQSTEGQSKHHHWLVSCNLGLHVLFVRPVSVLRFVCAGICVVEEVAMLQVYSSTGRCQHTTLMTANAVTMKM